MDLFEVNGSPLEINSKEVFLKTVNDVGHCDLLVHHSEHSFPKLKDTDARVVKVHPGHS